MTATARPLHGEPPLDPAPAPARRPRRPAKPARSRAAVPSREDFPASPPVEEPPYVAPLPAEPLPAAPSVEVPADVPSRLTGRVPPARAPFVVLLLVLLGGGLLCLLLLNTALTERAFDLHELEATSAQLAETEQALVLKVDELSNPAALAAHPATQGMVLGGPSTMLAADAPLPEGARVVARVSETGALLVVVPAPPAPTLAADTAPTAAGGGEPVAVP